MPAAATVPANAAPAHADTPRSQRTARQQQRLARRFLSLDNFEPAAQRLLPRPLFGYVAGATETNTSLHGNREAFAQWQFVPRVLVNVSAREQSVELFGRRYEAPFGIAPMGISALTAYRGDIVQARAAAQAGVPLVMLVNPGVPAKTAKEFVALARSKPGQLTYSSSGAGGAPHLAGEIFKATTETFIVHVPYRGGGPATSDLIAGHVQLSFVTEMGGLPAGNTPAQFTKLIDDDRKRYAVVIRDRKITVD